MEINYASIGECIRARRIAAHMTQAALAEKARIEPSNLSHIERAATKVSLPTLIAIANALHASLDELVYGSLENSTHISNKMIADILATCTPQEQSILADFLKKSLESFRQFEKR